MTPHLPIEDPSQRGSIVDRGVAYVLGHPVLRVALLVTVFNYIAALVLVFTGHLGSSMAGLLAFFSVLSWFFAVCLPLMNRSVTRRLGGTGPTYWGEVLEMLYHAILCALTGFYTVVLLQAFVAN